MARLLRVLLLEDVASDAELAQLELRRAGFAPVGQRVETEEDYAAALDPALDVILADYNLPQFDALRALQLLQERGLDVPFILVTGAVGEEKAVECLREGAVDYLLKDRLARLGEAVKQALRDKELRAEKRRAETEIETRAVQQAALAWLGQLALSGADLTTLAQAVAVHAADTLSVPLCEVLDLCDVDTMLLRAGVGWKNGLVGRARIPLRQDSRAAHVLLTKEPQLVEDLRIESCCDDAPLLWDHGVISGMTVPIRGQRRSFGVLGVHTNERRSFTAADLHFLESAANVLGLAFERQRAFDRALQAAQRLALSNQELEKALEQIRHAAEKEKLFLAATSHDVRSALTVISGYGEMLQRELPAEQGQDMAVRIRDLALTLSDTMMDLLQYGRLAESAVEVSKRPVAVRSLLADCASDTETQCEAKGLGFKVDLPADAIMVTDEQKLGRIFQNLLSNAVRYTPEGEVQMSAVLTSTELEVTVRDTGIGIPAGEIGRIFDPFYRLDEAKSLERYGSGLGLATVKRLCELLGGGIRVESTPRAGTAFTVTIPREVEESQPAPTVSAMIGARCAAA